MKPLIAAVMIWACWIAPASANDAHIPGENRRIAERCDEAAELEGHAKWDEALAAYLNIIEGSADELIPTDAGHHRWQAVKTVLLTRIANRSELRDRYRARFEANAERLVSEATARRDRTGLARLANDHRPCRAAGTALAILGDLDFELGDSASARHHWQQAAKYDDRPAPLLHAKVLLANWALGESTDADLIAFRAQFPTVRGWLAGREAVLADILADVKQSGAQLQPIELPPSDCSTFGADVARRGVWPCAIPSAAPKALYPPIGLPTAQTIGADGTVVQLFQSTLDFHPLIWRGHALINDGSRIVAYDLADGHQAGHWPNEEKAAARVIHPETLTIDGSHIYARLGKPSRPGTWLVCLQFDPNSELSRWQLRWQLTTSDVPGAGDGMVAFDGCPLIDDGRMYCSWTRVAGNRALITVAAFPADDPMHGPVWTRLVADVPAESRMKWRPLLLTRAGPNVVLGTDAGLVVAVDAQTGKPAWAFEYTSRSTKGASNDSMPVPRDIAPPIAANGRLFVVPFDSGEVFALDAWTGAPLWSRPANLETVHLLGVVGRRLIVTVDGLASGIAAIDVMTGRLIPGWGSLASDRPMGRGLIVGEHVLWPTPNQGLRMLRLDGSLEYPPTVFMSLPGGNLAYGDGYVVVATAQQLHVLKYPSIAPAKPKMIEQPGTSDMALWAW